MKIMIITAETINKIIMEGKLKYMSFNCQGFKTRMHNYLKEKFENYDVLLLQETWLYNFEHNLFKKILPDCQYHAVSAMDDSDIGRVGSPMGDVHCAIVWHKDLALSILPILRNKINKAMCSCSEIR